MKKIALTALLVLALTKMQAQKSVVTAGGNASGSNGKMSFTIGQMDFIKATGSGGSSTEGMQQPIELVTLTGEEFTQINLQIMVYPNPSSAFINLKIDNYDFKNLQYALHTISGKSIRNEQIENSNTKIDIENLPKTIYLLDITEKNKIIKTFKIIKN
jgi:hypothetical protein